MAPSYNEAEHALMVAILQDTDVGTLKYDNIRQKLGGITKNAVQIRWYRLRTKLMAHAWDADATDGNQATADADPQTPKRKKQGAAPGSGKKRKIKQVDEDTDGDMAVQKTETKIKEDDTEVKVEIEECDDEF